MYSKRQYHESTVRFKYFLFVTNLEGWSHFSRQAPSTRNARYVDAMAGLRVDGAGGTSVPAPVSLHPLAWP